MGVVSPHKEIVISVNCTKIKKGKASSYMIPSPCIWIAPNKKGNSITLSDDTIPLIDCSKDI